MNLNLIAAAAAVGVAWMAYTAIGEKAVQKEQVRVEQKAKKTDAKAQEALVVLPMFSNALPNPPVDRATSHSRDATVFHQIVSLMCDTTDSRSPPRPRLASEKKSVHPVDVTTQSTGRNQKAMENLP